MELLLVVGAIVLIALTVWIVWPARTNSESVEAPAAMTSAPLPPQGDQFEDQYTSATADLSAGGVAATLQTESTQYTPATPAPASASARPWPEADTRSEPIELPARSDSFRYPVERPRPAQASAVLRPSTIGILALSLLSAIGGAWLYARMQRRQRRRFRW
jgi:hypothetical protein